MTAPVCVCGPTTGCGKTFPMVPAVDVFPPAWTLPERCPHCGAEQHPNWYIARGSDASILPVALASAEPERGAKACECISDDAEACARLLTETRWDDPCDPCGCRCHTRETATLTERLARAGEWLAEESLATCLRRGWSTHWMARGAYLHLEASELIEAVRGKGASSPTKEAGDVLLVLMSITEANGIPWDDVVAAAWAKVEEFRTRPRYAGEEYDPSVAMPPHRSLSPRSVCTCGHDACSHDRLAGYCRAHRGGRNPCGCRAFVSVEAASE